MSTFQELLDGIKDGQQHKIARIESIKKIENLTHHPLIIYAANTRRSGFNVPNTIDDSDITGFSDLIEGINSKEIDIFLHSPGGSAEATERIVNLIRSNFSQVRFIIPNSAYSAATMLALCGDEILMDERSTLGPIDPQIIITTPQGATSAPVQDILDGFERIRGILKDDPGGLGAFLPMLQKYDLYIFEICENAKKLARSLAQEWLEGYMLKNLPDRREKASFIADKLGDHKEYLSHGRTIGIEKCKGLGLNIKDLREIPELRFEAWRLYCLIELLFDRSTNVKLYENSIGTSWARNFAEQVIQIPIPPPQFPPPDQPRS
ncbi:MAG: ATP-dependent Clp protease proteolytic subunit [Thermodesulfobacteriota bacterium]|nr:ATP-dependent Clp protease proteolytic subunit [Thermodesulfobacteriota bacterium]